jgi:hypothetical protein
MKTTIIKIRKEDKDVIAKTLADVYVDVIFYPVENDESIVQAEIFRDDPGIMWLLGKMAGHALATEHMKNIL